VTAFLAAAEVCERLARTTGRLDRARLVADFLATLAPDEAAPAVRLLLGQAARGETAVSGRTLWRVLDALVGDDDGGRAWEGAVDFGEAVERRLRAVPAHANVTPTLSIADVERQLRDLAAPRGRGSRAGKEERLAALLRVLSPLEAKYVAKNLIREMRTGAAEGIMLDALALLAGGDRAAVARALQIEGDVAAVAERVLAARGGPLAPAAIAYFRPLRPMLAQTAATASEALARLGGRAGVEEKLDGARVQVHRRGDDCRLYSRRLQELTPSLPDVVAHLRERLAVPAAILEGEVLPIDDAGRPRPFQELMRRFRRVKDVSRLVREVPVAVRLFDALQVGETPLIDRPYAERWAALEEVRGGVATVDRIVATGADDAERFLAGVLAAGHEGVMVKDLGAPYTPGIRGGAWLKVKRAVSVDLVIVAADRGYGRRRGWLSNYHLAARDGESGALEPVGKTFKGLTDTEFERMTERLSRLSICEEGGTVFVRPEVVVEVLFSDLQRSPTYRAGLALRFARILRVRDDKTPAEADTLAHLRALLAAQESHRAPAR
jgi:DNA ligase-1